MKRCSKCGETKPLDQFFRRASGSRDGRMSSCKACKTTAIYSWRERHPARWRHYVREWYRENGDGLISRTPSRRSIYKRKARYGIDEAGVVALLGQQRGRCSICLVELKAKFHVDHCHESKIVRGLLCFSCNIALGGFKDSIVNLCSAIRYLKEAGK